MQAVCLAVGSTQGQRQEETELIGNHGGGYVKALVLVLAAFALLICFGNGPASAATDRSVKSYTVGQGVPPDTANAVGGIDASSYTLEQIIAATTRVFGSGFGKAAGATFAPFYHANKRYACACEHCAAARTMACGNCHNHYNNYVSTPYGYTRRTARSGTFITA